MKKITLLLISLFLSIVASAANKRSIYVEVAGTLSSMISDEEKYSIEELTLTGKLNGLDFRLIREMAGNDYHGKPTAGKLRKLDLSGAVIVAGGSRWDRYLGMTAAMTQVPVPTATSWMLPSKGQWETMGAIDDSSTYGKNLRDIFEAVGGTNLKSDGYWSSTYGGSDFYWDYTFYSGDWWTSEVLNGHYVRACLAF